MLVVVVVVVVGVSVDGAGEDDVGSGALATYNKSTNRAARNGAATLHIISPIKYVRVVLTIRSDQSSAIMVVSPTIWRKFATPKQTRALFYLFLFLNQPVRTRVRTTT